MELASTGSAHRERERERERRAYATTPPVGNAIEEELYMHNPPSSAKAHSCCS